MYADHRTFLSWLHFAVVLGGLAVGLLNFGDKVGKISAGMYTIIGKHSFSLFILHVIPWLTNDPALLTQPWLS